MAATLSVSRIALATCTVAALLCGVGVQAQDSTQIIKPSAVDYEAAAGAQNVRHHAKPSNTPSSPRSVEISGPLPFGGAGSASPNSGKIRYPGDLSYHGGPVLEATEFHAIYLNSGSCNSIATCWGNPEGFLRDLGKSDFIHVVDQYTGNSADNRYTVSSTHSRINYTKPAKPFTDNDMLAYIHAVAVNNGAQTGYGNMYHIFLPPGQDECFDSTYSVCYSPDNFKTFFFCAYHGSADFNDIGHVIYSVEPYQNTVGCDSKPGTPNGQLIDSTNNVLSHETFEAITDPDPPGGPIPGAWWNSLDNGLYGQEIGDECSFLTPAPNVFFDPSTVSLNDKSYAAQPEYNNHRHACTTVP